jgi:predicted lipid-binding transport protein (Tim44 family)
MPFYISPPPRNPLASILTGIVGIVVLAGAFMLGFVALVVAFSIGLLIWLGIYIRIWWAKRQMIRQGIDPAAGDPFASRTRPSQTDSLDAEYEVISKQRDE